MKYVNSGLLCLGVLFTTACTHSPMHPVVHDFGLPVSITNNQTIHTEARTLTVAAPTWLWDNRLRYRRLYAPQTQIGFYALDLWIAPPPELLEQRLMASGKLQNYVLTISLQSFEQQFLTPDQSRVVMSFFVEAYSPDKKNKLGSQLFYLEQQTATANAAGAVNGFAGLTSKAADNIQNWLTHLSAKP